MKIVSLDTGRATWLFPTEEFIPLGGADGIKIVQTVAERYEFKNYLQNPTREEVDKNGLKFSGGVFEFEGIRSAIGEFALFNDGIVASSNTTEHSDAFLRDVTEFVIEEFDFRHPISPIKKVFTSILTLEFENAVAALLAKQEALLSLVGNYLNAPLNTDHKVAVTRLDLSLDDPAISTNSRPKLVLESRFSVPLSRRRYYSNAAIHTRDHLALLTEIEQRFMDT